MYLVGCSISGTRAAPAGGSGKRADPPVFAVPGEAMEYRVSLRGIVVGRMRVAIGEPGWTEGKRSIIVRTRGETDGVLTMLGKLAYELSTTIDLDRGLPIASREESWVELVAGNNEQHEEDTDRWSDNDAHHDAHSAVGRFRGWKSQLGERIELDVHVGGARLDVEAWHAVREYVPSAKAQAVRYDGVIAAEYAFSAWVSDDPSRVPLKFSTSSKWGAIVAELVTYHAPADH